MIYLFSAATSVETAAVAASMTKFENEQTEEVCSDFLQRVKESDVRKDLIIIKRAIAFGNFGTALFHQNKLSTENQTLPEYQIFDKATIEVILLLCIF